MLHSVAHATLSLRCIKVSREKSCNEQFSRAAGKSGVGRLISVNAMSVNKTALQYLVMSQPHSLLFKSLVRVSFEGFN